MEYKSKENMLIFTTKRVPQNDGNISEEINIDNYDGSYQYFFEFLCPQKKKFISELISFDGSSTGAVKISGKITENVGKVFVQLVIRDKAGHLIKKSLMPQYPFYIVEKSVNATSTLKADEINDALTYLIAMGNKSVEIANQVKNDANNGKFNGKDGTIIKVGGEEKKELAFSVDPETQIKQIAKKIKFVSHTSNFSLKFTNADKSTIMVSGCPYGKMEIYIDGVLDKTITVAPNILIMGIYQDNAALLLNYANKASETISFARYNNIEVKMYSYYGNVVVFEE